MNKFEENRQRLDVVLQKIKEHGMTDDLHRQLLDLYKDASILIVLGPNQSIERSDASVDRESADAVDLEYYKGTFRDIDFRPFFAVEKFGPVALAYEQWQLNERVIPCLRVTWEDKLGLLNWTGEQDFRETIEATLKFFNSVLGASWYQWKFQVIKEFHSDTDIGKLHP